MLCLYNMWLVHHYLHMPHLIYLFVSMDDNGGEKCEIRNCSYHFLYLCIGGDYIISLHILRGSFPLYIWFFSIAIYLLSKIHIYFTKRLSSSKRGRLLNKLSHNVFDDSKGCEIYTKSCMLLVLMFELSGCKI